MQAVCAVTDLQGVCQERLETSTQPSLTQAAAAVLGRPLDKRQQCSNWERRPLDESQMIYAALDAHVLILLASALGLDA
jgi:ribonuclease D